MRESHGTMYSLWSEHIYLFQFIFIPWPEANQAVCIFNSVKLKAGAINTDLNSLV